MLVITVITAIPTEIFLFWGHCQTCVKRRLGSNFARLIPLFRLLKLPKLLVLSHFAPAR